MQRGLFRGELSVEQRAIFKHIWEGKTGREAADLLLISPARLAYVVRKTCLQLEASGRNEAALIIASHHGWKSRTASQYKAPLSSMSYQSGSENGHIAAETVQTKGEHSARSAYVRDVGSFQPLRDESSGAVNEIVRALGISNNIVTSLHARRIFLLLLIIVSSTLALSALVAAMQGFDVLMFS